jgi:IS605 OrfB family transposase
MRTVKRVSVKLNKNKFERIERIARAFADEKQAHLEFYQNGLAFSESKNWKERRQALKETDHHQSIALSVHASDLAIKEAFETEDKYWSAIAADIHPRIGSRAWTDQQKHYAFWLLYDSRRFASLILSQAPLNDKIHLTLDQRRQVQNYLRRRARRMMGARPQVKNARSFVLDNTLYDVSRTLTGQVISIASLERGERIAIPLKGEGDIKGNIRVVLFPETRSVEIHVTFDLNAPVKNSDQVVALDVNLTDVFVDDQGKVYGPEFKEFARQEAEGLHRKGRKRNKLQALAKKYDKQGKKKKARNIRKYNLGSKKRQALKRQAKMTTENLINRAINEMLRLRQPKIIITENLDFRGKAQSKEMSRRVSNWRRQTLKERFEHKASRAGCERKQINPAYTSQTCPECSYLEKANRKGDMFQCLKCGHRGHTGQIAAQNQKGRYFDPRITLNTPREVVRRMLLEDYQARLEHRNASTSDEKIRTMTVPGPTSEREKAPASRSSRQSKSETAAGKSTKSAAKKASHI